MKMYNHVQTLEACEINNTILTNYKIHNDAKNGCINWQNSKYFLNWKASFLRAPQDKE